MTDTARRADAPTARVTVELRSVNQRFLDVKIVAPREYAAWSVRCATVCARWRSAGGRGHGRAHALRRGRYAVAVRAELARAYVAAAASSPALGLAGDVALVDVLRLPDVFEVSEQPPSCAASSRAPRRARARVARLRARAPARGATSGATCSPRRLPQANHGGIRRRLPRALAVLRSQVEERLMRLVAARARSWPRAQEVAVLATGAT